jgi:hypothetical protein
MDVSGQVDSPAACPQANSPQFVSNKYLRTTALDDEEQTLQGPWNCFN